MKKYLLSIVIIIFFYPNLKASYSYISNDNIWYETEFFTLIYNDTLSPKKANTTTIFFERLIKKRKKIVYNSPYYPPPPSGNNSPEGIIKLEFSFSPDALRKKFWMRGDNYQILVYQQNNPNARFCLVNIYEHKHFVHDFFDHEMRKDSYTYFPFVASYKKVMYYPKKTKKILGYDCYLAVVTDEQNEIHHVYITEAIQPSKRSSNSYYLKGCPLEISQPNSKYYNRAVKITTPNEYLAYHIPDEYETASNDKVIDIIKKHKYK